MPLPRVEDGQQRRPRPRVVAGAVAPVLRGVVGQAGHDLGRAALYLVPGLAVSWLAAIWVAMTLVIQVFVYPDAWPTHLSWAALLLYLAGRGGGRLALDRLLRMR